MITSTRRTFLKTFEVKEIGGNPQPPGTLMDTLWVPVNQSNLVWIRFKEGVGKTVYHCQVLPHEDTGMMGNLLIGDPSWGWSGVPWATG